MGFFLMTAVAIAFPDQTLRAQVREVIEQDDLSQADVARQAGVSPSTLSAWLAETYQGNEARISAQVERWLAARHSQQQVGATVPRMPGFLPTRSALAFTEALTFAQVIPEISVIAGGAGIGKTSAAVQYAACNPNVWLATMDPSTASVHPMLSEICEVMGLMEKSASRLARAIGRKVAGSQGLIIIDEAQHLTTAALDQLRSLHDRHRVGIALLGNETVYARLEGDGRRAGFAQLYSRVGVRLTQHHAHPEDVQALLDAWNVSASDEAKFLRAVARKPGALRGMGKCLQLASMLAAGHGQNRDLGHLKAAWSRLSAI
jgi:DNA transposition AAA+ family ATPase